MSKTLAGPDGLSTSQGPSDGRNICDAECGRIANSDGILQFRGVGLVICASIPQAVVAAPLTRSLIALVLTGLAALGLSILLAYAFGRPFAVASAGLAERAGALGHGKTVEPMSSTLAEFAVVADALTAAGQAIQERTRERGPPD
jgi:hypothetical protein